MLSIARHGASPPGASQPRHLAPAVPPRPADVGFVRHANVDDASVCSFELAELLPKSAPPAYVLNVRGAIVYVSEAVLARMPAGNELAPFVRKHAPRANTGSALYSDRDPATLRHVLNFYLNAGRLPDGLAACELSALSMEAVRLRLTDLAMECNQLYPLRQRVYRAHSERRLGAWVTASRHLAVQLARLGKEREAHRVTSATAAFLARSVQAPVPAPAAVGHWIAGPLGAQALPPAFTQAHHPRYLSWVAPAQASLGGPTAALLAAAAPAYPVAFPSGGFGAGRPPPLAGPPDAGGGPMRRFRGHLPPLGPVAPRRPAVPSPDAPWPSAAHLEAGALDEVPAWTREAHERVARWTHQVARAEAGPAPGAPAAAQRPTLPPLRGPRMAPRGGRLG